MSQGSAIRAEDNDTLRTTCAHCGKSIPAEIGYGVRERETWGLIGYEDREKKIFPTCTECYEVGWRPPGFVWE
jgi:hypothetical protein